MPQIFRIGPYLIYFWTNEGVPLEPVHVHISEGIPSSNATKVWITKTGKCLLANNNSKIPTKTLRVVLSILEARSGEIIERWADYFGQPKYFC
ncbi:DUF4160 domain-containing protein [Ruthenibacterium lactatiformans]|uniref:DUF4160 domain-containing protein n=1 Tax=Ruthenibacterium lactatiformans TaxID=1550024 RepID=UPI001968275B|nr:DUF4160 domain-containing protein [Ruthenibacterium lactatiformans]MBN3009854.1 DUF4160 domain-containing protein [Ruthenibacterium lactatiformans]